MKALLHTSFSRSVLFVGICFSLLVPSTASAVQGAKSESTTAVHIANNLPRSQRTEREEATQLFYQGEELLEEDTVVSVRKAITAWKIALPIYQELGVVRSQQATLSNLGRAYDKLQDYESAIAYYQQALTIAQTERDTQAQIELSERINNSQTQRDNL